MRQLLTQLTIYQQEDYHLKRWLSWNRTHFGRTLVVPRKPLIWTGRISAVVGIGSLGLLIIVWALLLFMNFWWAVVFLGIVIWQPVVLVVLGATALLPLDWMVTQRRKQQVQAAIKALQKLTVVGITGSYGKTSVKELVFEILDAGAYAMMTPMNFNTIGGIARAVKAELNDKHDYLVAELGAYQRGDITELAEMVRADWGVVTEVGPQHLERFGSLEVIARTKLELVEAVPRKRVVVNGDNQFIRNRLAELGAVADATTVTWKEDGGDYQVGRVKMTADGLRLTLRHDHEQLVLTCPLFGSVNVLNVAMAAALAWEMGIETPQIQMALTTVQVPAHRLELKRTAKGRLIENTYSSNVTGFAQVMTDLNQLAGKKALLTPGLVELGDQAVGYHIELGKQAAAVFAEVVLVGKTERTEAFYTGLRKAGFSGKLTWIGHDLSTIMSRIQRLGSTYEWVLWENDLPDHYF